MIQKILASVLLLVGVFTLSARNAQAQLDPSGPAKFKVGDRVEFDRLETNDPAKAKWVKATIVRIDVIKLGGTLIQTNYVIQIDPLPGKLPQEVPISRSHAEEGMEKWGNPEKTIGMLRPLAGGGTAPKIESEKLRVDENDTVLADRELLDCKNLKAGPARNGPPPPPELAKKLIRCLFEAPSSPGQDGATTVDIIEFSPGAPHRWNRREDLGAGATIDTMVYPFRVKFNQKTFYREHNEAHTDVERIFTCYVAVDQWYCGQAQSLKDGEKKLIQVKK